MRGIAATLRKRFVPLLFLVVLLCAALPGDAHAATPAQQKGLLITPIRQFLSVDAGKTVRSSLTVANLTDDPRTVTFSAKQFSVSDYAYNYSFSQANNDWLHLDVASIDLQPNQSTDIPYSVNVPAGSKPGGHYYTLFASADVSSQGVKSTIQAADLLYLTVNGKLIRTSHLQSGSIQRLSFGRSIPFRLQPVNTGNVYFFAYTTGELHGLFTHTSASTATHLLMPNKPRAISSSIASPVLPGIYKATYGYKTDGGQTVTQSRWIVFVPPWFIAVVLGALLLAGRFLPRRRKPKPVSSVADES